MYIVTIEEQDHSAWETKQEAQKQVETLQDKGYKDLSIMFKAHISTKNGYYFI